MPDSEHPHPTPQTTPTSDAQPKVPNAFVLLALPLPKFNLGRIVITSNADAILTPNDIKTALRRHWQCDWGDVCAEVRKGNERSVREQGMILSAYQSAKGIKFWVITDPGHEVTTVLLPEDY